MKALAQNKKASFDYQILETLESGISLNGQEVKSIRLGRCSMAGSYVVLRDKELYWVGAKIPAYQPKNAPADYDEERSRKLLVTKQEIKNLIGKIREKGLTLVPIKVYNKRGKLKLQFGIAKGKKKADKRELIKKRAVDREIGRAMSAK